MKTLSILLLSFSIVGCASSTQHTNTKVLWPSNCGPEPKTFSTYSSDIMRKQLVENICYSTRTVEPVNERLYHQMQIRQYLSSNRGRIR